MARYGRAGIAVVVAAVTIGPGVAQAAPNASDWGASTSRVSVSSTGRQGNDASERQAISANGRYVAFASWASNLVAGDTIGGDVFVRDRLTGATRRVSVGSGGRQANNISGGPSISADGRYIAFASYASNLVPGDTNNALDVFVRDVVAGSTKRISLGAGGRQGNGDSTDAAISADGLHVAFASEASNLVGGDTNGRSDVFVRNRLASVTRIVSVDTVGQPGTGSDPAISANGRYVAFQSYESTLVAGDTNFETDVFVRDLVAGVTRRESVGSGGRQANRDSVHPALSANGRHVTFWSTASNLVSGDTNNVSDVFVRDRVARVTRRVSVSTGGHQGNNNGSGYPAISADGRYVVFWSAASNFAVGDTNALPDVFLHDRLTGVTRRVSVGPGGRQANGGNGLGGFSCCIAPAVSAHGQHVAFSSDSSNLVYGDTNRDTDVFVRDEFGDQFPAGSQVRTRQAGSWRSS